jgi:hypothetical protein
MNRVLNHFYLNRKEDTSVLEVQCGSGKGWLHRRSKDKSASHFKIRDVLAKLKVEVSH